jgi:DNA-directed RNA polymerase subunit D
MIADVPKFAIDQMRIELGIFKDKETGELFESNFALNDEQLAHRFAMLPVPTFHDDFYFQDECPDCKDMVADQRGCPSCQIIYTITSSGVDGGRSVLASELNVIGDHRLEIPEAYGSIPLTKLYKGQVLHAYFYAIMGRGRDHAKYSPVSGVTFHARQNGKINVKTRSKMLFDLNLTITAKDFNKDGVLSDIDKVDLLRNDLNHVGSGTDLQAEFNDAITLEDVEGDYIFKFETDGSMTARTCLEQACKQLSSRFEALSKDFAEAL